MVVAGSELAEVGVEPVGLCGAVFYQFTAVCDQKGLSNCLCEGVGSWVFIGLGLVG